MFIWCEAAERFESSGVIVRIDEVVEMVAQLVVVIVVVAFDGGVFDGSVHPLHLAVCPRVSDFCEPVFNSVFPAPHIEHVRHVCCRWPVFVARWESELDAIVSENNVDLVWNGGNEGFEEG